VAGQTASGGHRQQIQARVLADFGADLQGLETLCDIIHGKVESGTGTQMEIDHRVYECSRIGIRNQDRQRGFRMGRHFHQHSVVGTRPSARKGQGCGITGTEAYIEWFGSEGDCKCCRRVSFAIQKFGPEIQQARRATRFNGLGRQRGCGRNLDAGSGSGIGQSG
jgi:hypothetical protein